MTAVQPLSRAAVEVGRYTCDDCWRVAPFVLAHLDPSVIDPEARRRLELMQQKVDAARR
jgi:hypothetical protein